MYLKLEIEGEESFHSFPDKNRVTIGRAPTCDIQVMVDGISRYHLEIQQKVDGECYAVDKGSTHGSFINEEQLDKDSPVAFNTFFPARLGTAVYIFLMDETVEQVEADEEPSLDDIFKEEIPVADKEVPPPPKPSETFNLDPPKKSKPRIHVPITAGKVTPDMHKVLSKGKKTSKKVSRSKKPTKNRKKNKTENKQKLITFALIAAVVGFAGFKQWQKIEAKKLEKERIEQQKQVKINAELKKEEQRRLEEIRKQNELKEQKRLAGLVKSVVDRDKCLSDQEVLFCNTMKVEVPRNFKEGANKELTTMYLVIDSTAMKFRYKDHPYRDTALKEVMVEAQKSLGRLFHLDKFQKRQNLRLETPLNTKENAIYFAFSDFLASFNEGLPDVTGLERLVIIAIENETYKSHETYDIQKLKNVDLNDYAFAAHLAFRSNILSKIKVVSKMFKYIEPATKK